MNALLLVNAAVSTNITSDRFWAFIASELMSAMRIFATSAQGTIVVPRPSFDTKDSLSGRANSF